MTHFHKDLVVAPGEKIHLKDRTAANTGGLTEADATPELQKHVEAIDQLQRLMYAEGRHSLLIVLQGLDTAGKDGTIRHIMSGINPQGCTVASFKKPSDLEMRHDFLWRVHAQAPQRGMITIFNRSHYEDVLVPRVHKLVAKAEIQERYELINDFERLLKAANQTTVLKFFLHISKDEQLRRFKRRLDDAGRNWKISEADYAEREYWDDYTSAYEALLHKTSTEAAPWFVIPADQKWYRDLAIAQIIRHALGKLKMQQPKASVDLAVVRREYHKAAKESE